MSTLSLTLKIIIVLGVSVGAYFLYKLIRTSVAGSARLVHKRTGVKSSALMDKRSMLLEKIKESGFPKKEVFVSVEDFFEGNDDDDGSIGVNIYPDRPSLKEFYDTLKEIEKAPKTQALLIRIADIDDTKWFYSDTIYISGNYTVAEIKKMFERLKPDEIYEGMMYDGPSNIPQLNFESKAFSIWWD